ncbi:NAD(P)-dependent oxidoreductase [bacterium]|nr:NAD(P)-dependent oxidoreductase [bacterium]
MPKALITGSGMVACALQAQASAHGYAAVLLPRSRLDVTDADGVRELIAAEQPELVLHTAALTRVNYCQEHPDEAYAVNRDGTANVVAAARLSGAALVYFSTDYVFNGDNDRPWLESDPPAPLNTYGASKLAGEQHVVEYERGYIVRTSGVFGSRAPEPERNFFQAIAARLRADETASIDVVCDQFTAITYAQHLAEMVYAVLASPPARCLHLTSAGSDHWAGWAHLAAGILGADPARIRDIATPLPESTPRPRNSVLGSAYKGMEQLIAAHPARQGLADYLAPVP